MNQGFIKKEQQTREVWAYLFILIIAIGFRFAWLGKNPLDDVQADLALQALQISRGENSLLSGEPGYLVLTGLQFFLFKASDFMARFWPALIGSGVVLLPLLYKKWLGIGTAITLAGLIAVDPTLISTSRTAGGYSLAMFGLFAGIGFLLGKKPYLAGICLGVALLGGVSIWQGLLIFGVSLILSWTKPGGREHRLLDHGTSGLITLGVAITTILLLSTLFLAYPGGISSIGSSLVEFFKAVSAPGSRESLGVDLAWLIMEIPLLILGIWGLIEGLLRKHPLTGLLGAGWGLSILLGLLGPGDGIHRFIWASIPMLVLAAKKIVKLFKEMSVENRLVYIAEIILVVSLIGFSFLNFLNLVNNAYLTPEETRNRIIGTLLPLILLAAITVLLAWGWTYPSTRKGFVTGILILFSFALIANSWKAAELGSRPQFEVGTDAGLPVGRTSLIDTMADISRQKTGFLDRIDIQVVVQDSPSLRWALKNFSETEYSTNFNPNLTPSLVVTGVDLGITSSASYRGQKILWSVRPDFALMKPPDWIKWAIFRAAPVMKTEVILWARNDLFPGGTTP